MQDITIKKGRLLEILRENRDKHQEVFRAAMKGYATAARQALEDSLQQLIKGGPMRDIRVVLERPMDHTADYSRIIRKVELHEGDTLTLDDRDVQQFIEDDWTWRRAWETSASTYAPEAYARSYSGIDG